MKKFLILLVAVLSLQYASSAQEVNYNVYDPATKKTYRSFMLTMGTGTPKEYYIALGHVNKEGNDLDYYCIITDVNRGNTLVKGEGIDINQKLCKWSEITPNTFDKEVNSLIQERSKEGMKLKN